MFLEVNFLIYHNYKKLILCYINFIHLINIYYLILDRKIKIKQALPMIISNFTILLQQTSKIELMINVYNLFTKLINDITYKLRSSEISLILNAIIVISSSSCEQRILKSNYNFIQIDTIESLFDSIYYLLLSLIRFRREQVLNSVGIFVELIKDILFIQ